jgi:hypothetical protein
MIEVHPDGTQDVLLIARAPDTQSDDIFYGPVIRGELAAAALNWVGDRYIIINWKKQSYFILQCHNVGFFETNFRRNATNLTSIAISVPH